MSDFTDSFDAFVEDQVMWINDSATSVFDFVRSALDGLVGLADAVFAAVPYWALIAIVLIAGWFLVGRLFSVALLQAFGCVTPWVYGPRQ